MYSRGEARQSRLAAVSLHLARGSSCRVRCCSLEALLRRPLRLDSQHYKKAHRALENCSGTCSIGGSLFAGIVSLLYPAAIVLCANIAHRFIAGEWVPLSHPRGFGIVFSVLLLMPVCASEEIGWRGYALPRLTKALGLRKASLILGPVWACWHLPLFLLPGMRGYGQSVSLFVLGVTALSVVFAWLYTNTNGSLIPVVLLHTAMDEVLPLLPKRRIVPNPLAFGSDLMPWFITAFECLIAAYMLARMPRTSSETETQAESVTVDRP